MVLSRSSSQTISRPYYEWALEEIKKAARRAKVHPYDEMVRGAIVGLIDIVACEERTKSKWHVSDHYGSSWLIRVCFANRYRATGD